MRINSSRYERLAATFVLLMAGTMLLHAGPGNIAGKAKVTASVELNSNFAAANINDGLIRIHNLGEWASDSHTTFWGAVNYPWIQLNWDTAQCIDKIIFYDRPTLDAHLAGGTLEFSDGTKLSVNLIPNDGSACVVTFPPKSIDWFRFVVTDGTGDQLSSQIDHPV